MPLPKRMLSSMGIQSTSYKHCHALNWSEINDDKSRGLLWVSLVPLTPSGFDTYANILRALSSHMAAPKTCESASARGLKYWPISELTKEGLRNLLFFCHRLCPSLGNPMGCSTPGLPVSETWVWQKWQWARSYLLLYDRGWDGWMASPTQWTWVWVDSESWGWQGGLACCGSWGHKATEQLKWTELNWYHCQRGCELSYPHSP